MPNDPTPASASSWATSWGPAGVYYSSNSDETVTVYNNTLNPIVIQTDNSPQLTPALPPDHEPPSPSQPYPWPTTYEVPTYGLSPGSGAMEEYLSSLSNYGKKKSMGTRSKKDKNEHYNIPLYKFFGIPKVEGEAVGLEIECEGKNLFNNPISYWSIHQDHSLRHSDGHPPCEYVLKKPLSPPDADKALNYLSNKLKETGSQLDTSTRTSVHVHVNCSTNTIQDVVKFICLYIIYERLLIEWCGNERIGNLFCLRVEDAQYFVELFEQALKTGKYSSVFHEDYRYMACNVASLQKYGTVEFRGMKGTVDKDLINVWINILLGLKTKALTYNKPSDIVEHFMRVGPREFLEDTFPSPIMFRNHPSLNQSTWDGLRLMRDIAYATKWKPYIEVSEEKEEEKTPPQSPVWEGPGWTGHIAYRRESTAMPHSYNFLGATYNMIVGRTLWYADIGPIIVKWISNSDGDVEWRSYNNSNRDKYLLP